MWFYCIYLQGGFGKGELHLALSHDLWIPWRDRIQSFRIILNLLIVCRKVLFVQIGLLSAEITNAAMLNTVKAVSEFKY